jgi:SAM-dependent methyltransferase
VEVPSSGGGRDVVMAKLLGFITTQAIGLLAELGIADELGTQPRSVGDLARRAGANEDSLFRLLRFLAAESIVEERPDGTFCGTSASEALRSDSPHSLRPFAILMRGHHFQAWEAAADVMKHGRAGFPQCFGQDYFAYLERNREVRALYDEAMAAGATRRAAAVARAVTWDPGARVIDIGGGNGAFLCTLLSHLVDATGIIFDRPEVRTRASAIIATSGLADRCEYRSGDMFCDPIPPSDVVILSKVLHTLSQARALDLLRRCRSALRPGMRLLIVEGVVDLSPSNPYHKGFDLHMLIMFGGRERTAVEWQGLIEEAGFGSPRFLEWEGVEIIECTRL